MQVRWIYLFNEEYQANEKVFTVTSIIKKENKNNYWNTFKVCNLVF